MQKEAVAISAGVTGMVEAIIPVLLLFNVINWSPEQIGAVVLAIGIVAKTIAGWIARKNVYSQVSFNAATQ